MTVPRGKQIVMYAEEHKPLWSSEIVQVIGAMQRTGCPPSKVSAKGGGILEGTPSFGGSTICNYPVTLHDHNDLAKSIGKSLGLYEVNAAGPMKPLSAPPAFAPDKGSFSLERLALWAVPKGYDGLVVLTCKSGDAFAVVEGKHRKSTSCTPSMPLLFNRQYDFVQEAVICWKCGEAFDPLLAKFTGCSFKCEGTVRPHADPLVLKAPGSPDREGFVRCTAETTVPFPHDDVEVMTMRMVVR